MSVPDFQSLMLPLLQYAADGQEHSIREAIIDLAQLFQLSESDRAEMLPSGKQPRFDNRVHWAGTYLRKSGLLRSTGRARFCITERGYAVLDTNPPAINIKFLRQFPELVAFKSPSNSSKAEAISYVNDESDQTPQEELDANYKALREQLIQDLIDVILTCSPTFFEHLVVDLLLAMGYGGTLEDSGEVTPPSHDGGIDGIIKEDKLGFDIIAIQAKRYGEDHSVGRQTVQSFAGSLVGRGINKGVFITTSYFTRDAQVFAHNTPQPKMILVDGRTLAELMIDHNIGVSPVEVYTIKKIDSDYFGGE
ncbi:MAG: restriction endonuclease [Anaerolineae bacterium]|nr:restriction endonuclease [Anaerolineae bacterium]